jgi:hypothetical protein
LRIRRIEHRGIHQASRELGLDRSAATSRSKFAGAVGDPDRIRKFMTN